MLTCNAVTPGFSYDLHRGCVAGCFVSALGTRIRRRATTAKPKPLIEPQHDAA